MRNTKALEKYGFDGTDRIYKFMGGTIYPSEYFCPVEYGTGITHITQNTVSIHHYEASWKTKEELEKDGVVYYIYYRYGFLGKNICRNLADYLLSFRKNGLLGIFITTKKKIINKIDKAKALFR